MVKNKNVICGLLMVFEGGKRRQLQMKLQIWTIKGPLTCKKG